MMNIMYACETYTWQMPGEQYKGRLEHIMSIMHQAGFEGIEPETSFLGQLSDPLRMQDTLAAYDLQLAALCHVEMWANATETDAERANADKWMNFLSHFPDTVYLLVQLPGADRSHLEMRQNHLLSCVNDIAERAYDRGITCSYHPNSPMGSIFRTREDYMRLLEGLKSQWIGYTPDVGHIAKGGMNPLGIIQEYRELINLVHYKDIYKDGRWAPTGEGVIDMQSITAYLNSTGYKGWIVMEDECDRAIIDPDQVTLNDGAYLSKHIKSWQ